MVNKEEIKTALKDVGIKSGDSAIVHSSLKAFGKVENGPDDIIDAMLEVIGPEGTVVFPTFTLSFQANENVIFDMVNSRSETGVITELFRKRPGVLRSSHLVHSVAVKGKRELEALGDGILPCGKGSPFEFLYNVNAWNIFLGVGFTSCTALHMVEEYIQVPYRYYKTYPGSFVIFPDGSKIESKSKEYVKHPGYENDFEKIESIFAGKGILNYAKAGEAKIISVKTRDIFKVTKEHIEKDPHFLVRKI